MYLTIEKCLRMLYYRPMSLQERVRESREKLLSSIEENLQHTSRVLLLVDNGQLDRVSGGVLLYRMEKEREGLLVRLKRPDGAVDIRQLL